MVNIRRNNRIRGNITNRFSRKSARNTYIDNKGPENLRMYMKLQSYTGMCAGENCNKIFAYTDLIYYDHDNKIWLCSDCINGKTRVEPFYMMNLKEYNKLTKDEKSRIVRATVFKNKEKNPTPLFLDPVNPQIINVKINDHSIYRWK